MKKTYITKHTRFSRGLLPAVLLTVALMALAAGNQVLAGNNSSCAARVLPPNSHPYGKTYGEWSAAWWQWVFSLETIHSPQFGTADCSAGQSGQVWFLPGTFSGGTITEHCTIPEGKALFFPIFDAWADNTGCPPTTFTVVQLRAFAASYIDPAAGLSCSIDGVAVPGVANPVHSVYRVPSPVFSYTLPPDDNVLQWFGLSCYSDSTGTPITVPGAVADGLYIMLAPLPEGHHTIHITGAANGFAVDITYLITVVDDDLGNPGIFPPESYPYGRSYGEWSAKDWQWIYSLPADHHPLFDTASASTGQSGPVWFLGGTYTPSVVTGTEIAGTAVRNATVPYGKALLVPLISNEASTAEGNGTTDAQLRATSVGVIDHAAGLACEIDGRPVMNLKHYRAQSPLFTWGPLPANSVFQDAVNYPAGLTSPSVSDGYFLVLEPLRPGHHTIHYTGAVVFTLAQDGFDFTFSQDITYHLTVAPGQ